MGKNYANRKPVNERPAGDAYPTPPCITEEFLNQFFDEYANKHSVETVLEPCAGDLDMSKVLYAHGYDVMSKDIKDGHDFLTEDYSKEHYDAVITNFPFSLFDKCVEKAKQVADIVVTVGRLNCFGSHGRNINGFWKGLEYVLPIDRMVAFDKPLRTDGKVECGMLVSCFFVWNKNFEGLPSVKVIDVQKHILSKGRQRFDK